MIDVSEVLGERRQVWPDLEDIDIDTGFRDQHAVDMAASLWPSNPTVLPDLQATVRYPQARYAPAPGDRGRRNVGAPDSPELRLTARRYGYLEITPGVLSVRWRSQPTEPDHYAEHGVDCDCDHCQAFDAAGWCPICGTEGGLCMDCEDEAPATRVITEFTHRAKMRMMRYIASIDWASARDDDELLMVIDLTYPGEWRHLAPTPADAQKHLKAFVERFNRATGRPFRCIWVREFQEREAPHFHLLALWPKTINGELSKFWLSRAWYEIVGSGDPRHLTAGTRLNYKQALRGTVDPKRAAAYFAGYCEKNKGYQHQAPDDWRNPNGSAGGFWGHRGLKKASAQVAITEADDIEIRRLMRRMVRAQKRTVTTKVGRSFTTVNVDARTGEVVGLDATPDDDGVQAMSVPMRMRRVTRRWRLKSLTPNGPAADGMRGFTMFANDAPLLAAQLARYLHSDDEPWPPGERRPLP